MSDSSWDEVSTAASSATQWIIYRLRRSAFVLHFHCYCCCCLHLENAPKSYGRKAKNEISLKRGGVEVFTPSELSERDRERELRELGELLKWRQKAFECCSKLTRRIFQRLFAGSKRSSIGWSVGWLVKIYELTWSNWLTDCLSWKRVFWSFLLAKTQLGRRGSTFMLGFVYICYDNGYRLSATRIGNIINQQSITSFEKYAS